MRRTWLWLLPLLLLLVLTSLGCDEPYGEFYAHARFRMDADRIPAAGVTIYLTGHDEPISYMLSTDADGNCTLDPMESGSFYILADFADATNTPPGFTPSSGTIDGSWVPPTGENLDKLGVVIYVSAVNSTSVDIELID